MTASTPAGAVPGRGRRRLAGTLAAVVLALAGGVATGTGEVESPQRMIAAAARRVVKVHGAGGPRGLESYQTGILVSPDGRIATALSTVLDSDEIDCVLDDGTRHRARLVGIDPRRELALLAIDAADLPSFTLTDAGLLPAGTRVVALSNLFGVAVGDERVSAQRGVIAARVPLQARRGAAEAPYTGDVYVLDCTTNNPGSPGGAVVDARGRLVGMLGKELRATDGGIWLNYALPVAEVAAGVEAILAGAVPTAPAAATAPFDPGLLGLVLVPDLLERTPPFVESLVPGSAAARSGLRPDDLVIAVAGRPVATLEAVRRALGTLAVGDPVQLSVIRDGVIVDCDLGPRPASEGAP